MPTTIIRVRVKPHSRVSALEPSPTGLWHAQVRSPPTNGKANEELISLVARHFHCKKREVTIKSGASGRMKLVQIDDP